MRASITAHFNLECAATEEMRTIVERLALDTVTLVPERRQERTTEGRPLDARAAPRESPTRSTQASNDSSPREVEADRLLIDLVPDEAQGAEARRGRNQTALLAGEMLAALRDQAAVRGACGHS